MRIWVLALCFFMPVLLYSADRVEEPAPHLSIILPGLRRTSEVSILFFGPASDDSFHGEFEAPVEVAFCSPLLLEKSANGFSGWGYTMELEAPLYLQMSAYLLYGKGPKEQVSRRLMAGKYWKIYPR